MCKMIELEIFQLVVDEGSNFTRLSGKVVESTIICIVVVFSHFSKLNDGGDSTRIGGNSIKNDDEVVTPLIGRVKVVTPRLDAECCP